MTALDLFRDVIRSGPFKMNKIDSSLDTISYMAQVQIYVTRFAFKAQMQSNLPLMFQDSVRL